MGRPGKKAQRLGFGAANEVDLFGMTTGVIDQRSEAEGQRPVILDSLPEEFDPHSPESSYRKTVPVEHRKRFAQFFTPEPVAQLMVDWVFAAKPTTVLDPSVGPGVFLRLIQQEHMHAALTGVDIDAVALAAAEASLSSSRVELRRDDFLTWADTRRFEAILCNPPYLRHHDMHYEQDIFKVLGQRNGVSLSKLTNMYVLFILEICRRLAHGGRAAVIVPGEWTNANFGMALKQFLLGNGLLHSLIYFSNMSEQFEDALTTAAILLIERRAEAQVSPLLDTYYVEHTASIAALRDAIWNGIPEKDVVHRRFSAHDLIHLEKWDKVLRDGLAEDRPGFVTLGTLAKSRRGIATGANEFFHVSLDEVQAKGFRLENTKPCVGRSEQVQGLLFSLKDFEALEAAGARTRLLDLPQVLTSEEAEYVDAGVQQKLHERYLLATRKPWYSMEKRPPALIWAAVFGRSNLRFVFNEAGVSNLTTFHCIYPNRTDAVFCKALVACLNSRVVQEMAGHQRRVYGGGLLKFEPKDLLSIQVPDLEGTAGKVLEDLATACNQFDVYFREGGQAPDSLLDELDDLVLKAAASVRPRALL